MVLYVLNRQEELLTVLHNDSELDGILELSLVEDLAELSTLDFDVSGNTDGIECLSEENYILTQNMAGKWKLFVTRKVTDIHGAGITKRVYAEDILSELGEYTVGTNYVGQTVNVKTVLTALLKGTGFVVGEVDETIPTVLIDKDTRYISKLALVQMLAELTDLHIFTNVTVNGSDIADVSVSLTKTNKSEGKRFEFDGELDSIQRDVDTSAIKTAILPLGSAIEQSQEDKEAGRPVEYVNISGVEWFKAEGKPLDKPRGQDILVDPGATAKYGIKDETGEMQPRVIVMQFSDIDDPELLAERAFLELDKLINPQVNFTFSASDMSTQLAQMGLEEQPVEVGDVCYVIDNSVNPPIIQEVVIRRIAGNPDDRTNMEVEIGKPLSSFVDDNGSNSFTGTSISNSTGGSGGGGIKDGDTVNALTIINGTVTNLRVINGSIQSLTATSGEFEELSAKIARIQSLFVGNASFDTIIAGKADVGTVTAVDADLQQLKAKVAYVEDLNATNIKVETLEAGYARIDNLLAGNITADNIQAGSITSASGVIGDLSADHITTGTLDAGRIKVTNLSADVIKTGTIDASLVTVTNIDATHIGTGTLDAGKITVKNLSASSINTGTLDASLITVTNLSASSIVTGTLDASRITVTNLNASSITAGTIDASRVNVTNINASNITTGTIDATRITISNMNAGSITGGTIDAVKVQIINLNASNITSGTIDASRITVTNLNASNITGGTLDANRVNVTNLKADNIVAGSITVQGENMVYNSDFKNGLTKWSKDGTMEYSLDTEVKYQGNNTVKIVKSGATADVWSSFHQEFNCSVGDTFVASAYVKVTELSHNVYLALEYYNTGGTRVGRFTSGISAPCDFKRLVVSGVAPADTAKVRIRLEVQRDAVVNATMFMLSRGTIASVWKPHTDELISDGAISNDKIADGTIQSGKLFLDEILASTAFIEKFRAVEIDANQIKVNKITSDQLDVGGIVSFTKNPSIFGEDMNWIFDTSQDQTWINGGAIWANSVTADKINAKGLRIETADKVTAFQVFDKASADASNGEYKEGDVLITGTLKSSNFDDATNMGYKITKDGKAILNEAIVRGSVILPTAGITNGNLMQDDEFIGGIPAEYAGRNLLNTPQIVTDPSDIIYAQSGFPNPPLGGTFNSYDQVKDVLRRGELSSNGTAWAIISACELYHSSTDEEFKGELVRLINTVATFMLNNVTIGRFNSMNFRFVDADYKYDSSADTWTVGTYKEIYVTTLWLQVKAFSVAYTITGKAEYEEMAKEVLYSIVNTHFYINNKVTTGELPPELMWASYEFLACDNISTNNRFVGSSKMYANQMGYYIHIAIESFIRAFGDIELSTHKGDRFTPSSITAGYKSYLLNAYNSGKLTATPTGLPYGYYHRQDDGVTYKLENWDFIKGTWGDTWFVGDVVCYIIQGFAYLGLKEIADQYAQAYYSQRVDSQGELLFYDRLKFEGGSLDDDKSISITYTALALNIFRAIGPEKYADLIATASATIHKYQVVSVNKRIDGAFPWDVSVEGNSLELKSFGEIMESKYFLYHNVSSYSMRSTNKDVRFWAGADFKDRDKAPFQVLQDGTVKAKVGEFGGTFTGQLAIGNIHIVDTNESMASFKINTNNNAQTLVELTEDTSFINTDFILGSKAVPHFTYTKGNGSFKFTNAPVSIEGTKSFVRLPADNSSVVATVGFKGGTHGDYSHEVKYSGGGLRLNQTGVTGEGISDFQFTKDDGGSDVTVSIQGNVQVTNTIQMGGIQIINRTKGSEKRIDFVVL